MNNIKIFIKIIVCYIMLLSINYTIQAGVLTILENPETEKKIGRLIPLKETIFVNGKINPILLTLIDHKNKTSQIMIQPGNTLTLTLSKNFKKVICSEKHEKNITIGEADLKTYEVFVFNTDQKIEKYYFKTIQSKELNLQKARNLKDLKAFQDMNDHLIYNP